MTEWLSVLQIAEKLVVIFGVLFALHQVREAKMQRFLSAIGVAESDFATINQVMLDHPELLAVYRESPDAGVADLSDEELKRFVFLELYYGHLARTFVLVKTPMNPMHHTATAKGYWALYRNFIRSLIADPIFLRVHAAAKAMKTFEPGFMREVDSVIAEARPRAR